MCKLGLITAFCLGIGCRSGTVPPDEKSLLGKPVATVLAALGINASAASKGVLIEEPPGIFRGIRMTSESGDELWIYVARESYINAFDRPPVARDFDTLPVGGIARKSAGPWSTTGDVIFYYHENR